MEHSPAVLWDGMQEAATPPSGCKLEMSKDARGWPPAGDKGTMIRTVADLVLHEGIHGCQILESKFHSRRQCMAVKVLITYKKKKLYFLHFGSVWICAITDYLPRNIPGDCEVGGKWSSLKHACDHCLPWRPCLSPVLCLPLFCSGLPGSFLPNQVGLPMP